MLKKIPFFSKSSEATSDLRKCCPFDMDRVKPETDVEFHLPTYSSFFVLQ